MADLKVELTAPNGKKISLPTGLFINNEFVKATGGQKVTSINPTYVAVLTFMHVYMLLTSGQG